MFSFCPRCETGKLDAAGSCKSCGYSLRTKCSDCNHLNFPGARFCGGCGRGMTLSIKVQSFVNRRFNYLQKSRLRKFSTGLAFGTLLSVFAFGSMGMQSSDSHIYNHERPAAIAFNFRADFAVNFENDLATVCAARVDQRHASAADLHQIVDLLIKHLKPLATRLNKKRIPADSSADYVRVVQNFSSSKEVTRGSSAMILFHFLSDFLEFSYRDFPQESSYKDIPRFHFMCVPANALKSTGVDLAKEQDEFAITEPIGIEQLCNAARSIVANAEIRANKNP